MGRATEPKGGSEYPPRRLPHIFIYAYVYGIFPHKRTPLPEGAIAQIKTQLPALGASRHLCPLLPSGARAAKVLLLAAGADLGDL